MFPLSAFLKEIKTYRMALIIAQSKPQIFAERKKIAKQNDIFCANYCATQILLQKIPLIFADRKKKRKLKRKQERKNNRKIPMAPYSIPQLMMLFEWGI